jgi:hypothetical protein
MMENPEEKAASQKETMMAAWPTARRVSANIRHFIQ